MDAPLPKTNLQIKTFAPDNAHTHLHTELVETPLQSLQPGEVLAEILFVPLHGSFWLASHPDGLHPRKNEFLQDGAFVFGNSGVGRVIAVADKHSDAQPGDFVAIFGHTPCTHSDCHACTVTERYTECSYNENTILGHGKSGYDGTYASYSILPKHSYEIAYHAKEKPAAEALMPLMYASMFADVENVLTRHPNTLQRDRVLLFGAGQSGHVALHLLLHHNPETRILVVDPNETQLASVTSLKPKQIASYLLPQETVTALKRERARKSIEVQHAIENIKKAAQKHFQNRKSNLVFDTSSGNSAPLWDNTHILGPDTHVLVFGFGSDHILLPKNTIQLSGLTVMMSRGVGTRANRRQAITHIQKHGARFIAEYVHKNSLHLQRLEDAYAFIQKHHGARTPLHKIPQVFMTPRKLHYAD